MRGAAVDGLEIERVLGGYAPSSRPSCELDLADLQVIALDALARCGATEITLSPPTPFALATALGYTLIPFLGVMPLTVSRSLGFYPRDPDPREEGLAQYWLIARLLLHDCDVGQADIAFVALFLAVPPLHRSRAVDRAIVLQPLAPRRIWEMHTRASDRCRATEAAEIAKLPPLFLTQALSELFEITTQ